MPDPLICECGDRIDAATGRDGTPTTCPSCGRDVSALGPRPAPPPTITRWWVAPLGVVVAGLLLVALLLPSVRAAREAARRSQCVCNLKCLVLAVHNYHEVYGSLPPAAVVGRDGRPLLSWRVLLLPYMEGRELYARFRLDEPWDSPRNRPLLAEMPNHYACPSDLTLAPKSGLTGYQVVVGRETAFPPDFRPMRFDDITDGTANTLLVGETIRLVPWTKPDDLHADDPAPLVGLGSHHFASPGGFNMNFADGVVWFQQGTIPPATLRCYLTRAGGDCLPEDRGRRNRDTDPSRKSPLP